MTTPSRTGSNSFDASGGNLSSAGTIPAGTNLALAFWQHWDDNSGTSASALAINGVAMTILSQLAEGATADELGVGVAILVNPGTGSLTHALTWSAGGARTEGGRVVFAYYQDGNTGDPYRAVGTNAAASSTTAPVALASTATTDMVVGLVAGWVGGGSPAMTGITPFINNLALNGDEVDVGEDTGLSGTVTVSNSNPSYTCTAAISLKESVAGGDPEGGLIGGKLLRGGLLLRGVLVR